MKAIYGAKLYKGLSSDRQNHVKAALDDPLNLELVTQLKSYLDEEYQEIAEPAKEVDIEVEDVEEEPKTEEESSSDVSFTPSSPASFARPSFGDRVDAIEDDLGELPDGEALDEPAEEIEEEIGEEVEESTTITKAPITASIQDTIHEVKGMLNLDGATAGVARVALKGKELWIYYQDDVNLNNVMYDVMDKINTSGYSYLEFNRLARSDNAIVFDVDYLDTENEIKPIDNEE